MNPIDIQNPEPPASKREIADRKRGYSINYKFVGIAYLGEIVLIVASLIGAWLFAQIYGHGDTKLILMMMLAPISYAVVEMCRVPLAIAARTQKSIGIKLLAGVGVILAAGVTVKSLSQLGEQMFHPRLVDVVQAKEDLNVKQRERDSIGAKIEAADSVVEQRSAELKALDQHRASLTTQMGTVEKPTCMKTSGRTKKGGAWTNMKCTPDPKGEVISQNLRLAGAEHSEASTKLDLARVERAKFDPTKLDIEVSDATKAHRTAVLHSQLHSFTAMVFGKDPSEVSDAEVHQFLRLFVFFPAIFASLASTLLALASVNRVVDPKLAEDRRREAVSIPDAGGQYVLSGLAEHIIRETTREVHRKAADAVSVGRDRATLKSVA